MAQYYEVLSQGEKTEQQFYTNVEDQTVQYVITPDKTQVQFPTQQIVVTSGDQLMVVDSEQQQIVIDQTPITYQAQQLQPQQIQVQVQQPIQLQQQQLQVHQPIQVQTQQFAVIQDGLNNGTQQIFYMEGNSSDRVLVEQPIVQQSQQQGTQQIVLNHQLTQSSSIVRNQPNKGNPASQLQQQVRAALRQPLMQTRPQNRQMPRTLNTGQQRQQSPNAQPQIRPPNQQQSVQIRLPLATQLRQPNPQPQLRQPPPSQIARPVNPNQQQFRPQVANQAQIRQQNQQPQIKQTNVNQQAQIRQPVQQRAVVQQAQKNQGVGNARFQAMAQAQQQKVNNLPLLEDLNETEVKPSDEHEAISLPDGTVVSVAVYKKMVAEQKARNLPQRANTAQPNNTVNATATPPNPTAKRRNANPRANQRQASTRSGSARPSARNRNAAANQFTAPQQRPPQPNDPSRYAMMNQQQQALNKTQPQQQFQNQMQNSMLQQQQQRQQQMRQSQANYVIQPPKANQKPQQQRPLPSYIPSTQIQKIIDSTPVGEEFSDSIRMLVLLENGEQRLITFTLPKEACTIQEILEQVNVPFRSDTNIQVTEANTNGINYIVTVGNVPNFGYEDEESQIQEESPPALAQPPLSQPPPLTPVPQTTQQQQQPQQGAPCPPLAPQLQPEVDNKSPSPEPPKEISKYIPGMLALCAVCGYLSEDFAKCIRCGRKLPENVKAVPANEYTRPANGQKKDIGAVQQAKNLAGLAKLQTQAKKRPTRASKIVEHESVVISSDEEEEEKPKVSENILQKLGASITISPVTKEPSANEIQKHSANKVKVPPVAEPEEDKGISTTIQCRTIRIGSYRFVPPEKVIIHSRHVIMKVPHPSLDNEIKTIQIDKSDIVKVLASFNKSLPVFFYYLNPALAKLIREELDMVPDGDYYYDPLSSKEEAYRRITLLPDDVTEEDKEYFHLIYGITPGVLDELNVKEANDILIKTCPKELTKAALGLGSFTEIKQLLTYPPEGRGRISINTEDYVCLAQDQFLNDVIIDFYLKFLVENLPDDQKPKVHIFSTFFYKRLTTKPTKASRKSQPSELDPTLTPAQKRHARVKTWTKNVNLFEKDFVVVPINENAHWFLAIICFPGMEGPQTWDGKPYKLEPKSRKKKKITIANIGTVSVTTVKQEKVEKPIVCEDPELSDKDEAEGDESEMDSDDSEELPLSQPIVTPPPTPAPVPITTASAPPTTSSSRSKEPRPHIKQSCILIFDSLAGASRCRVVATLRDYLTCEYKAKLGKERIYNKDIIKGANPKVPQQTNFTDCGLYLLQYVEQFFSDPIRDYHIPISQIKNWFEEIIVTKKREDIAILIRDLMNDYGKDVRLLPDIAFPTINGKLVERETEDEEDEMMEDDEFGMEDEHEEKDEANAPLETSGTDSLIDTSGGEDNKEEECESPLKPSSDGVSSDFVSQAVVNPKPDFSEVSRQSNRDTLSYLKAKRIIRHKTSDGPDVKKLRSDQMQ